MTKILTAALTVLALASLSRNAPAQDSDADGYPLSAPFSVIKNPAPNEGFFWGFQMTGGTGNFYPWTGWDLERRLEQAAADIKGCGAGWTRAYLFWGEVEPKTAAEKYRRYLGRSGYPRREDVSGQMVEDYAFNRGAWSGENANRWGQYDVMVKILTDNGVGIFLNLGQGDEDTLPSAAETGERLSPGTIGREQYLGLLHLHCRGAARRYGPRVQYYQLEDELNAGWLRGVAFYRTRRGADWADERFKEDLLSAMGDAVLTEGQHLGLPMYRMVYLHTFLSDPLIRTWRHYAVKWAPYYDLVGLDVYPNSYTLGWAPGMSASVSLQIDLTAATLERAGYKVGVDKFVYISETSFATAPLFRGYSEDRQARAVTAAVAGDPFWGKGVLATPASGFCWGFLTGPENSGRSPLHPDYPGGFMGIVKPGDPVRHTEAYHNLGREIRASGRPPLELPRP